MISISSQQAAPPTTMDPTIQPATMKKPAKSQQPAPTKIRRTRQARNPQLSVARRNERERNRVKMVNNGFALLRQHLPVEHLQHQASLYGDCDSGSDTPSTNFDSNKCPTPAGAASSSKAKKFSKVETLRAAIQHIKMLEELMRSDEPNFESMNIDPQGNSTSVSGSGLIQPQQQQQQQCIGYDETDNSAQMIEAASPSFNQTSPAMHTYLQPLPDQHQTFVRLSMDSSPMQPQQHQQPQQSLVPSPPNSQISQSSCNSNSSVTGSSLNQPAFITSQSHSHHQFSSPSDSHTHLWLEQHHNSFVQQQQQHYSEQQWYQTQVDQQVEQANGNWQQQQQHPQPHSPVDCESAQSPLVWYSNSTLSPPEVGSSESDAPTPMRIKCEPSSASNLSSIKQQQQQPIHYTTSAEYIHHASHHLQAAAHQQQVSLYSQ